MTVGTIHSATASAAVAVAVGTVHSATASSVVARAVGTVHSVTATPGDVETTEDLFRFQETRAHPASIEAVITKLGGGQAVSLLAVRRDIGIYEVPTGRTAIIHAVVLRCTEAMAITAVALAGVGVSGDDVYPDQQLLGLDASGRRFVFPRGPGTRVILTAGDTLNLVVSQAAVGTSQVIEIDVFGDEF